ncbi:MAG: iron ABC transporter permease [Bacteroidales bacterium]|nr:iron ABC transporter permease [Bacteroidales bacterium]
MKSANSYYILIVSVLILAGLDLCVGSGGAGIPEGIIFTKLRLPRCLTALLAGASLSLAGLQMQSIFRNPLADPHIMGVSAGAGTGAAVATLLVGTALPAALSGLTVVTAAFVGALLSSILVMAVASRLQSATTLLVFGVMLGFVFSAVTSILEYSANAESLKVFYSWSAGSFLGHGYPSIVVMAIALLAGLILAVYNSRGLDVTLFGDEYVAMTGLEPARIRNVSMVGSCLMAGAVTAFCGPIGFVGIVAPHLARSFTGSSVHVRTIPAVLAIGAGLSLLADILSQVFPAPLPVGSTMAIIGIPIILYILLPVRR